MRTCGVLVASLTTFFTAVAHAGFVVTTSRSPITSGTFAGKDGVTLFIQNIGGDTNDPTFGNDLIYYDVTMSSSASSPQFFLRTWDGTIRNPNSSLNTRADFGYQGFMNGDLNRDGSVNALDLSNLLPHYNTNSGNTWETGDFNADGAVNALDLSVLLPNYNVTVTPGSYVRFGSPAQFDSFFPLNITPSENSQIYTDGQSVPGFDVSTLTVSPTTAGLPDGTATQLAFAVVPTGQSVTFSGQAAAHAGSTQNFTITDAGAGLSAFAALAPVPEPASIGLLSLGALALCRSRREKKHA